MINKNGLKVLLEGARERLGYTLEEMSVRTGIPRSTLDRYEGGEVAALYEPDIMRVLCKHYEVTFEEVAYAAGYTLSGGDVNDKVFRLRLKDTTPEEYVSAHYGVSNPAAIVAGMEVSAYGQQYIEHRAKDREGSGPNPIG